MRKKALESLYNKPVWLPKPGVVGQWEKMWVNNIVIRARNHPTRHPSACLITDIFLDRVRFECPNADFRDPAT